MNDVDDRIGEGQERHQDFEVDIVPHVCPDHDKGGIVRCNDRRVEIVEHFGGLSKLAISDPRIKSHLKSGALTAKKKSEMSCVIYTANPMYVKWNA